MKLISACIAVLLLCIGSESAEARGVAIINTGEDIVHVSDIKEDKRAEVEEMVAPNVKIGMIYSRFGLFWMDIWRWDTRWVLYTEDAYNEYPKEELQEIAATDLSAPLTMKLPAGLIVLILGAAGLGLLAYFGKDEEDEFSEAGEEISVTSGSPDGTGPQDSGGPNHPGA